MKQDRAITNKPQQACSPWQALGGSWFWRFSRRPWPTELPIASFWLGFPSASPELRRSWAARSWSALVLIALSRWFWLHNQRRSSTKQSWTCYCIQGVRLQHIDPQDKDVYSIKSWLSYSRSPWLSTACFFHWPPVLPSGSLSWEQKMWETY